LRPHHEPDVPVAENGPVIAPFSLGDAVVAGNDAELTEVVRHGQQPELLDRSWKMAAEALDQLLALHDSGGAPVKGAESVRPLSPFHLQYPS
jgi:hypothetical protein